LLLLSVLTFPLHFSLISLTKEELNRSALHEKTNPHIRFIYRCGLFALENKKPLLECSGMRIDEMRFYAVENNLRNCKENNSLQQAIQSTVAAFLFSVLGCRALASRNQLYITQKMRTERVGKRGIIQLAKLSFPVHFMDALFELATIN
jgi:hypothetical protein